ncbi:hypothetical protein BCR43DRAFT_496118 [Syncephalastrum racemosum]|uniref:sterol 3beta-glucosyltransferase n=1 Tax=Syncephalastrum racemosum TaxID=13706 RepID=A0A1X2H8A3_SYNRA|nr:hypothetical protein BCR43DRAFT_496118 [Syncephalastrum racemosum]
MSLGDTTQSTCHSPHQTAAGLVNTTSTEPASESDKNQCCPSPETGPKQAGEDIRRKLERSYSEMSIECMDNPQSIAESTVTSPLSQQQNEDEEDEQDAEDEEDESFVAEKIRSLFGLHPSERLLGEFPCYLVRLVTLPGWLYVTNLHVCFYASLPGKENVPRKVGYLSKKNHRASPRSYRYFFELRNHVLSYYESAENKYVPLDNIDLKQVIDIRESKTRKFGFQVVGTQGRWLLAADSEVSQKEWMDELRRGVFIAKNTGNSVRLVLPYAKMAKVNKTAAFEFAEYIRIKVTDPGEVDEQPHDEYYFAFFPDIELAYKRIHDLWSKSQSQSETTNDGKPSDANLSVEPVAFPQEEEDVFGNVSSGMSAMLVGALTSPSSFLGKRRTQQQQRSRSGTQSSQRTNASTTTKTNGSQEDDNKRSSWSFPWFSYTSASSTATHPPPTESRQDDTVQLPPVPPGSSAASDEPAARGSTKKSGRFRSASTASIRQLALQSLGRRDQHQHTPSGSSSSSTPSETESTTSTTSASLQPLSAASVAASATAESNNGNSSHSGTRTRSRRSGSLSGLMKHARKVSRGFSPHDTPAYTDMTPGTATRVASTAGVPAHKSLRSPSWWISRAFREALQNHEPAIPGPHEPDEEDEAQYQAQMNEQLMRNFPMLGDAETVIAAFGSALWRTLPYYGRLFITQNHICFHSKVLAGRQRMVIPTRDITSIRRLKSKGYYLLHGIGIIPKDLQDEIYFEFSSVDARDRCYGLFYLLSCGEENSIRAYQQAGRPVSIKLSDILAISTEEHVLPPSEYSGPPLLSTVPTVEAPAPAAPTQPMHITCLTIGSRGDVQPYIALAKELQKDGHLCRIATHAEYKEWVEHHDIEFRSIGGDPGELMKLCVDNGFLSYSFIKEGMKFFYTWFEELLETAWDACQGTDMLIESPSAMVGVHMAEKLEIPYFRSMPFPWTRTTRFSHPFATQNYTRGRLLYNDMTYTMIDMALWTGTSKQINRFRRSVLGLPPTTLERLELWRVPHIYSFSPSVLPPPKDWPDYVHCTGYWFLDNPDKAWHPDPAFLAFLDAADERPIVYIGFGSIVVPDPEAVSATIVEAVLRADVRAIICKGWSSRMKGKGKTAEDVESSAMLDRYPGTIYSIDAVPHDWLFPRIQGVVHHGGAGTTAAGLRAGLPTIVKPFFGDQRFWGQRLEELGVGLCLVKLTVDRLADAIKTITQNKVMVHKASALGETLRQENGARNAVECIYHDIHLAKRIQQKAVETEGTRLSLLSARRHDSP